MWTAVASASEPAAMPTRADIGRRRCLAWLTAGAGTWAAGPIRAQGHEPIRLGASLPLSGELAREGQALLAGARAALAQTPVRGRAVTVTALDDGGRTADTLRNVQALAADPLVVGLLGTWGLDATEAVLPVLETARLPMIGPVTGAERVRAGGSRQIFPVRAGLTDEAARLVTQLDHQSLNDMAVVHTDDAFGRDALAAVQLEMNRLVMRPVCVAGLAPDGRNLDAVLATVGDSRPHAVIVAAPTRSAATFIRRWSAGGFKASLAVFSETGTGLHALLGPAGRGVAVSQVWPSPWRTSRTLVRDYQAAMRAAHPGTGDPHKLFGYASLEGYIDALLALKALQRIGGREPGRDSLQAALETGEFDLDGIVLNYGRLPRSGHRFSEMTVMTADGALMR